MSNKKPCELCGKKPVKLYLVRVDKELWEYWCEECIKDEENLGKETFPKI